MPRWFRRASSLVFVATLVGLYFRELLGPVGAGLLGMGLLVAGVSRFLILLSDRRDRGVDDPAQLNLQ